MKRLFYAIAAILAIGVVVSCEDTPKNPGDFNKKCVLEITGPVVSLSNGREIPLKVARDTDTTYRYLVIKRDTVWEYKDGGKDSIPVIGSDGKPITTTDSIYVFSKITARLVEMEPVYLPGAADTFKLDINSNARWLAAAPAQTELPQNATMYYFNENSSTTGGGNSSLYFRTIRNRSNTRTYHVTQRIITSDSSVMYLIPFYQYGEKDQPADF